MILTKELKEKIDGYFSNISDEDFAKLVNQYNKEALSSSYISDIIEELNSEYHFDGCMEHILPFTFKYGGWRNGVVTFMGEVIWSEDNDERDYIEDTDEKEPLYGFLLKEAEKIIKDLGKRSHNVNLGILKQFSDFLLNYNVDLGEDDRLINEFLNEDYN